ncbi:MAG: Cytosolic copper metallochaperone [Geoglossum simile]|nr:MAG: Cytosolic copper metallochaperone [Geoglossum simile]
MADQEHHYKFGIIMHCGGCSGAVDRVLKKLDGITKYEVSLENQTADVYTEILDYDTVLKTIAKTGKKVTSGENDGKEVPMEVATEQPGNPDEPAIVTGAE